MERLICGKTPLSATIPLIESLYGVTIQSKEQSNRCVLIAEGCKRCMRSSIKCLWISSLHKCTLLLTYKYGYKTNIIKTITRPCYRIYSQDKTKSRESYNLGVCTVGKERAYMKKETKVEGTPVMYWHFGIVLFLGLLGCTAWGALNYWFFYPESTSLRLYQSSANEWRITNGRESAILTCDTIMYLH